MTFFISHDIHDNVHDIHDDADMMFMTIRITDTEKNPKETSLSRKFHVGFSSKFHSLPFSTLFQSLCISSMLSISNIVPFAFQEQLISHSFITS